MLPVGGLRATMTGLDSIVQREKQLLLKANDKFMEISLKINGERR